MMRRITSVPDEQPSSSRDRPAAPLDVFYVVETTGQVSGERHYRVRSHLFETRLQAHIELTRLEVANANSALSIWKGMTYIEPADWSYDVVMADGTVIPARRGNLLSSPDHHRGLASRA